MIQLTSFCYGILISLALLSVSTTEAGASPASNVKKPSWLNVDRDTVQQYMDLARQRHQAAIDKARSNYNLAEAPQQYTADEDVLSQLHLKPYKIQATGNLPDFQEELDKQIFVTSHDTPLFTAEECRDCIDKAEAHFAATSNGEWTQLPSGQYTVAGLWIKDVPEVHEWFLKMLQKRLFPLLVQTFPDFCKPGGVEDLVVDNAYLFKYTPETGRRTDVHTDSGCLTFTISLNSNQEYQGGGTWFEGLQGLEVSSDNDNSNIITMSAGGCTVRPGGVRHCGHAVTEGTRYIIGGFCMQQQKIEYVRMLLNLGVHGSTVEERQTALEVAIALNPQFDGPYTNLADLLVKERQSEKAKQVLQHCLENVNPRCGEVAYTLGSIYYDEGDYAGAKKCMQVCLEADDSDIEAMMMMAQAHAGDGNRDGEKEWYERLVSVPGANDKAKASAYCNLGVLYEGQDKEIDYYRKSLALSPDIFATRYSLACAYGSREQWTEAAQEFRAALGYGASNPEEEMQAIKNLYRVAMEKIKVDHPQGVASPDAMMKLFRDIMGTDNFNKLAAASKK